MTASAIDRELGYLIDHAPVIVLSIDADGTIVSYRGAGMELTGGSPETRIGKSAFEIYGPDHPAHDAIERALAGETVSELVELPDRDLFFDASFAPVRDDDGKVVGAVAICTDATAREQALRSLREADARMAEVDRVSAFVALGAGIAHEINNPLTYVSLNLGRLVSFETARKGSDELSLHRLELLQEMREGLGRVERLVADLRGLATAESGDAAPIDVWEAIEAALRLTAHETRHRAKLLRAKGTTPPVLANWGLLEQLAMNLLVHAAHTIPEGESHLNTITVSTRTDDRGWAVIEVADTGIGLASAQLERLLATPGSSLSICRTLAKDLGGEMKVRSMLGAGSGVTVALPPAELGVDELPLRTRSRTMTLPPDPERGRVLIIDDERAIGAALAAVLGEQHEVVTAGSGREAFEILRHDDSFDIILCDLLMPEITGVDLYEAFHIVTPAVADRFVFMTGGAIGAEANAFLERVPNRWISKPFEIDDVKRFVAKRLHGSHAP